MASLRIFVVETTLLPVAGCVCSITPCSIALAMKLSVISATSRFSEFGSATRETKPLKFIGTSI